MRARGRFVFLTAAAFFTYARASAAGDVSVSVEPSVGIPVGAPQASEYHPGGGGEIKADFALAPAFALEVGGMYSAFPGAEGNPHGSFTALGGGARVQSSRENPWAVWADTDLLYVDTGGDSRFGFSGGVGALFAVTDAKGAWLGPFIRYDQIVESGGADAHVLNLGFALEIGSPAEAAHSNEGDEADADKDGIPDRLDRCPNVAGSKEKQGCPTQDSDQDGVPDEADKCVDVPGPAKNNGCPYEDTDKDGVLDRDDACPDQPGPLATKGCPDRDHDGVSDREDKCPAVPGEIELQGCPRYKQISVTKERIILEQKIYFAYDKDEILPKSFELMDEVVKALLDRPGLHVRIDGHTDDRGSEKHNVELSRARAVSVAGYLVTHGIEASRLQTKGYGSAMPLESNATVEGREKNRRVEFIVSDESAGPANEP